MDDVVSERLLGQLFADPDDQEEAVVESSEIGFGRFTYRVLARDVPWEIEYEYFDPVHEASPEIFRKDLNFIPAPLPRDLEVEVEKKPIKAMFDEAWIPKRRTQDPIPSQLSEGFMPKATVSGSIWQGSAEPLRQFSARVSQLLDEREATELARALEEALEAIHPDPHPVLEDLEVEPLSFPERLAATTEAVGRRLAFEREEIDDSWTPEQAAEWLGVSMDHLGELRESGNVVALESDPGRWHYPRWQFAPEELGKLLDGLSEVLEELEPLRPLSRIAWLRSPKPTLDGSTPLEALREGDRDTVLRLARSVRGLSG